MNIRYLDSTVFIQGILREDNNSKKIILDLAKNKFVGVTSVLTWDEVVHVIKKFLGREVAINQGKKLFTLPNLVLIDAKKEIVFGAQKIVEKYGLNPRDAIHVASALSMGAKEIISQDSDFDCVSELKRLDPKSF